MEKQIDRSRPGLHVACAGYEVCQPDYVMERQGFPCYGLEYVESGGGSVWLDQREFPLRAGVLFIYGPATSHRIVTAAKSPLRKYFVDFFGREAAPLLRASAAAAGTAVQSPDPESFRTLFEMLLKDGGRGLRYTPVICAQLLRTLICKAHGALPPGDAADSGQMQTFQRCRDLIEGRYLQLHSLDDISRMAGIDKSYLCRLFRSHGYPPPYACLVQRKINRAAEWLMSGQHTVKEIAGRCGFPDPYHFSRVFKRTMGQSPRDFSQRRKSGTR